MSSWTYRQDEEDSLIEPVTAAQEPAGNMGAKWIGSPNFGYPKGMSGRKGHEVIAIVVHIAQGSLKGCDTYFQEEAPGGSPDNAVSAHFCVGKSGELHQYVDIENAAWANGKVEEGASLPLGAPALVNPNLYTVSIEHEGFTGQSFALSQIKRTISLCSFLCDYYKLRPNFETILPHARIAPQTRRYCPGTTFPLGGIIDVLRAERGMVPLLRAGRET